MTAKQHFLRNWKLYGLTIGSFTLIPCYYDLLRFGRFLAKDWRRLTLSITPNGNLLKRFFALFDTSIKEWEQNTFIADRINSFGSGIADRIGSVKVWSK